MQQFKINVQAILGLTHKQALKNSILSNAKKRARGLPSPVASATLGNSLLRVQCQTITWTNAD